MCLDKRLFIRFSCSHFASKRALWLQLSTTLLRVPMIKTGIKPNTQQATPPLSNAARLRMNQRVVSQNEREPENVVYFPSVLRDQWAPLPPGVDLTLVRSNTHGKPR